jgi:SAM-dependent methyltransferase
MRGALYDADFYADKSVGSRRSAAAVLPVIMGILGPRSVVDIGCGVGTWLAEVANVGIDDYLGIDGDYVPKEEMQIPLARFRAADLNQPLELGRIYDLAISLEVAEHLPSESSSTFIGSLVEAAPAVLFSAAIPGQGGSGHVNEQWQDYWRALFATRGYVATDAMRRAIWGNAEVVWWYQQNMVLYVERETLTSFSGLEAVPDAVSLNVVHPHFLKRHPTLGEVLPILPRMVKNYIRNWLRVH